MIESNTRFSLSHINLSKLVSALLNYVIPFFPCTRSFSRIILSRPSLTSCLKIAEYHSAPVLWNNFPSHLRQVVHHVTPSPILNSPVSNISTSLFLEKSKTLALSLFLSSLVCINLGYLDQDWYLRYWPSFVFQSHTHFTIIHRHICHSERYYLHRCAVSIICQRVNKLCTPRVAGGIGLS